MTWDAVSSALSYQYSYRIDGLTGWITNTTTSTSVSISNSAIAGKTVRFRVKSICDEAGENVSAYSSQHVFTAPECDLSVSTSITDVTAFGGSDGSVIATISGNYGSCLLYTSPSPRDRQKSRMPSSA